MAMSLCLFIPLPILIIGAVSAAFVANRRQQQQEPQEASEPALTDAEMAELEVFSSLFDNAPDEGARRALLEEFYPSFSRSI